MAAPPAGASAKLLDGQTYDFLVTVSMRTQQRLGIDVDWGDGKTLYINAVHPGAIDEWNRMQGPSRTVRKSNRIMAVNGVSGDAQAMLRECQAKRFLQLLVRGVHEEPFVETEAPPDPKASDGLPRAGAGAFIPGAMPTRTVDDLLRVRAGQPAKTPAKAVGDSALQDPNLPPDFYTVLDVERGEDDSGIKRAYRKLVLKWHPDKHPVQVKEAEDKIRLINRAYEILSNPSKRSGYDKMLAALQCKRNGVTIDTSFIKPRMSIPKEFLLCPLGHPDKFVRVVDDAVYVQSRDDAGDISFTDFFQWAKFSLWWLPEVNNMCRLRVQESTTNRSSEGSLNINFMVGVDRSDAPRSEIVLNTSENPRSTSLIAMASPFIEGAYRFEGAFWPNRHLRFNHPASLEMANAVDNERDIIDFLLVDYSAMYNFMTMDEVLAKAVQSQGKGNSYVKLGDLRADMSVRVYFQRTLGVPVWNNRDFEIFFEGHFEQWDYDQKRARVRLRTKEESRQDSHQAARTTAGVSCLERLQHAEGRNEVTYAVLRATEEELAKLPLDAAAFSLERLSEPGKPGTGAVELDDLQSARRLLLVALPAICEHAAGHGAPVPALLQLHRSAVAIVAASDSGDTELSNAAGWARRRLAALTSARIRRNPGEVSIKLLADLLAMPFEWESAVDSLSAVVSSLLAGAKPTSSSALEGGSSVEPGSFLEPLRVAAKAGEKAKAIAESLAHWELKSLPLAQGPMVAEILLAMAEGSVLVGEVVARLRPPILQRLPLPELVKLVAVLGEQGLGSDALRPALSSRVAVAGLRLQEVPAKHLLQLAVAATKSPVIGEIAIGPVAGAAAANLTNWSPGDVAELLLVVSTIEAGGTSSGANKLFTEAAKVMIKRVETLDAKQLLKTVLAVNKFMAEASQGDAAQCRPLFEAAATEAATRLTELRPSDLLLLTQGVLSLGGQHPVVVRILDHWVQSLSKDNEGCSTLPSDDIAQLVRLIALVAPEHILVFEAFSHRLIAGFASLSSTGRALLDAAFPGGGGPAFPSKALMLQVITRSSQRTSQNSSGNRSRSRSREPRPRSRSRNRSRDRGRNTRRRSASSPRGRGSSRSASRSPRASSRGLRGWPGAGERDHRKP